MRTQRLLHIGCGDIGLRLAQTAFAKQREFWGLRRQAQLLPDTIKPLRGSIREPEVQATVSALAPDWVVVTLTPDTYTEEAYQQTYVEGAKEIVRALSAAHTPPKLIIWVSSTRVYHQSHGEWVDEHSPTNPATAAAQHLLDAERVIQASGLPHTIVRFSGIYGPGRERLLSQVRQGVGCPSDPPQYTNRIHADDCAGSLAHLLSLAEQGQALESLYVATDSEPIPLFDVKQGLADLMCLGKDWQTHVTDANRGGSKRCSNQRLRDSGYTLLYPSWRQGYQQILSLDHSTE